MHTVVWFQAILKQPRFSAISIFLFLFSCSIPGLAEILEAKMPKGVIASANFHRGLPALPAILIMHGFQQTANSPPMSQLADNLSSRGYTVLSPTSTLGINRRSQSMACEAMHTYTPDDEANEVDYWVKWLKSKGHKHIVTLGFSSTGALATLLHNTQHSESAAELAIYVAMVPIPADRTEHAKVRAASTPVRPGTYSLGYCKRNYVSSAQAYLSYAQYDAAKVLDLLNQSRSPAEMIYGTDDTIVTEDWRAKLGTLPQNVRVTTIKGASHFFEGDAEFELADEVEAIIKRYPPQ